jgi:hypothetical protein
MKLPILLISPLILVSCKSDESVAAPTAPQPKDQNETSKANLPLETEGALKSISADPVTASSETKKAPTPDPEFPKPPAPGKYKIAKNIPGKPGYVSNPFTGGDVDVRGIPPGALVRDPNDQNPDHTFRVPHLEP